MALTGFLRIPTGYKEDQERAGANMLDPVASTVKMMFTTAVPDHQTVRYLSEISATEVATGTGYIAGGPTMASVSITPSGDNITVDMDDVVIPEDNASGFTICVGGAIYLDNGGVPTTSRIWIVWNAGGNLSNTAGPATVTFNVSGLYTRER